MSENELLQSRIQRLASSDVDGKCVLYVMSRDQRAQDNHALLAAQRHAITKDLPLAVVFCLYEKTGYRRREHFSFMLGGLREVESSLGDVNIPFMMLIGNPYDRLKSTIGHLQPDAVYFDMNPLRGPRRLQQRIAYTADCKVFVVDTHNVIPVWVASDKKEFGAYTIRPKIHKKLADYLVQPGKLQKHPHDWPGTIKTMNDLQDMIDDVLNSIPQNDTQFALKAGESAAHEHLQNFIKSKLERYAVDRNDPSRGSQSDLSPYLHFGHMSSLRVALELQEVAHKQDSDLHFLSSSKMPQPEDAETSMQHGIDSLIEEMIVRKELADNYCWYDENYDNIKSAHDWAKKTIAEHDTDPRKYDYSYEELRDGKTHDPAWNAAQLQMRKTGKMHGYMRMYWAKKILEWSPVRPVDAGTLDDFSTEVDMDGMLDTAAGTTSAEEIANSTQHNNPKATFKVERKDPGAGLFANEWAIAVAIKLNDTYSIDGGDPNGYAGIMWSIAGVHDRAWNEREVFGKIRYMNYGGLKRKFDIEAYEKQWLHSDNATLDL